ncbi:MAG: histidinol dehydrogenase [Desulfobacterales bacterium]|nr:histidinol dehydrogenase [Desulfobacterales bacterium]MCF8078288.1 histidinol dehydrogenase [Desulfobacterales bacterium]
MKIYDYPSEAAEKKLSSIVDRGLTFRKKDQQAVSRILDDVRQHGDDALVRYTRQFDAPEMSVDRLLVSEREIKEAVKAVDQSFTRALNRAAAQIESFHRRQLPQSWITTDRPGTLLGQMVHPVKRAGVYVPGARGGKTPLVSSVLMGAIPAKIAGVEEIVMATPPMEDGAVNAHLLAAAKKVGVDKVFKVGSAWAVGAMAYGTESIPKVDVIVGPGNIYVTLAKKLVAGTVGIDMIAGPSEILVIADDKADPAFAAADLLSQAEHDPLSSAILITPSRPLAEAVVARLKEQIESLDRKEIAAESIKRFGALLVVSDLAAAVALANRIAPEHLELLVENPFDLLAEIRNAGAVFLGSYTPEPIGDYIAGPNHVLPTAGTARFASALSVDHFVKKTSVLRYSREAFQREAKDAARLADIEGLGAHARSIRVRLGK